MGTQIGCTVRKLTEPWTALVNGTETQPFFKMAAPYLMFICTWRVLGVLTSKANRFDLVTSADYNVIAPISVSGLKEIVAKVRKRLAVVDEVLRTVQHLYVNHVKLICTRGLSYINKVHGTKLGIIKL